MTSGSKKLLPTSTLIVWHRNDMKVGILMLTLFKETVEKVRKKGEI